jgi:UDP-N-acetylmuramoyl-L-alanyl-D-glutamate--2,6-diaminopimelate ligase
LTSAGAASFTGNILSSPLPGFDIAKCLLWDESRKGPLVPTFEFLTPHRSSGVTLASLTGETVSLVGGSPQTVVTNVAVNSRELHSNGLFAALPGRREHGARHYEQAVDFGAVAILTDPVGATMITDVDMPLLVTADPRSALGRISARIHGTDRRRPLLLGVTGTNGKTSTVHLLHAILEQLEIPAGRSSTADRHSGSATVASRLTSPEAPELHALLARMNEDGVKAAAVEVSAQALTHNRVDGIVFDVAGFTNLSHDHLDEYASMSDYLDAKLRLFTPEHARRGVILLDSPSGTEIRDRAQIPVTTVTSRPGTEADWQVSVLDITPVSTRFVLAGPTKQTLQCTVPLIGGHMAADAALAIVMLVAGGIDFDRIASALSGGLGVEIPGRTDLVSGPDGPRVYTDFSHTPDSVDKTLMALRSFTRGRLIVVIGADGEKDHTKREPMGRAAGRGADVVIVTDHHQRFEDPARIRNALLSGARATDNAQIFDVPRPSEAIRTAIGMAAADDTILWVGPGRTDYRIVRGVDIPFSARADAKLALAEAGWA